MAEPITRTVVNWARKLIREQAGCGPPPSDDGSCHCGKLVMSTDTAPCPFCGGYTAAQLAELGLDDSETL